MINIRSATPNDAKPIADIFYEHTGRIFQSENIAKYIEQFPSLVALNGSEIIGFCYSCTFAPDILELQNIFVSTKFRGVGIGKRLLTLLEESAFKSFKAIILVNSKLYPTHEKKFLATSFYLKCGYSLILSTEDSNVFAKYLN